MEKQSKYSLWAVIIIMVSILLAISIIVIVKMDISVAYAWANYIAKGIIIFAMVAGIIQARYEKKSNIKSSSFLHDDDKRKHIKNVIIYIWSIISYINSFQTYI